MFVNNQDRFNNISFFLSLGSKISYGIRNRPKRKRDANGSIEVVKREKETKKKITDLDCVGYLSLPFCFAFHKTIAISIVSLVSRSLCSDQ